MRLVSNIAFVWVARLVTLGSSALIAMLTARALGPAGRGMYSLPAIDASIAVTFSVGLSSAASYYLINRKVGVRIVPALLFGSVVFATAGAVATIVMATLNHSGWAIVPALLYMVFYAGYSIVCGYYLGRDRARTVSLINAALSLVSLTCVAFSMFVVQRSASSALVGWVCAIGVVAITGLTFVYRDARKLEGDDVEALAFVRFGAKAGLLNVANLLNYRIDIIIVAMLLPVATVGLYTIAVAGAESLLSVTLAIGQATLPRIGALERSQAADLAARCLRNTLLFSAILCVAATFAAPIVVRVAFGHAFTSIVTPARVLLIGIVAASTASILSNYFVVNVGQTKAPLATSVLSTVLCALISVAIIPRLGMLGAAIASTVAYTISQTLAIAYFCKVSGIRAIDVLLVDRRDLALYGRLVRRAVKIS